MSTLYLVSHFDNLINVVLPSEGAALTTITGNYVVKVPDDVPVNPTDLSSLIAQKYQNILGTHGLFTQIVFDDLLDHSGIDSGNSFGVVLGNNGNNALYPTNAGYGSAPVLQTTPRTITWAGPGSGPSQAMLTYELFEYVDTDDKNAVYIRQFREIAPDTDVTAQISFNGGANWIAAPDRAFTQIVSANQGTSVIVKLTRATSIASRGRVHVGSIAVLF